MSRRQSYPESNRQIFSYQQQIKDLRHQIQIKNQQIQDLNYQLNNLRKKQSIWHHLDETYQKVNVQEERKSLLAENDKLKSQLVSMLNQMQRKNKILQEQAQKINDLKQYSQQVKKLNQKFQTVHKKQLQILKSTLNNSNELNIIKKQKEKLQNALSKCDVIARQMQQYYMGQVQKYKKQVQEQKNVIVRLQNNKNILQHQIIKKQQQIQQLRNKINILNKNNSILNDSRQKQSDFNQLFKRQTLQKKWELILTQTKQRYQKQTSQLKDQIRFLILKIQSLQDTKSCYEGLNGNIMAQSIYALSSTSNDSFRFNPNNSYASSIKQSLSRRQTGALRTPSKSSRQCNNLGYLLDRTNL